MYCCKFKAVSRREYCGIHNRIRMIAEYVFRSSCCDRPPRAPPETLLEGCLASATSTSRPFGTMKGFHYAINNCGFVTKPHSCKTKDGWESAHGNIWVSYSIQQLLPAWITSAAPRLLALRPLHLHFSSSARESLFYFTDRTIFVWFHNLWLV